MGNDCEEMEADCDIDFFESFKFGSIIGDILQKWCLSVDFFQEIAFNHLVRAN